MQLTLKSQKYADAAWCGAWLSVDITCIHTQALDIRAISGHNRALLPAEIHLTGQSYLRKRRTCRQKSGNCNKFLLPNNLSNFVKIKNAKS